MKKLIPIIAALCISIATIGFLLVSNIFEDNIRSKREENVRLISSQQDIVGSMEKANSYRELAILLESHQDALKILNAPNDIFQKQEKNRLTFYRYSVLCTTNAIVALKKWDENQDKKASEEINTLTVDQLKDRYREYMKIAVEGVNDLSKKIDDNKINISNLEYNKNVWWYICFFFQSLGLFFGLFAIILEKNPKSTPSK